MSMPNESGLPEPQAALARNAAGAVTAGASPSGGVFVQSLSGGGTPPVVAVGAGAGAGASIQAGSQKGHDLGGSFVITTAGTPAAGALATVTFGTALAAAPAMVLASCWDQTGSFGFAVGPTSISGTGFTVSTGVAATTAHNLLVNYVVIAA
jgi:hypothetical protein